MKTPLDVFNNMRLILAHIEDIKVARGITASSSPPPRFFEKKPVEVFQQTVGALKILNDISCTIGCGPIESPAIPNPVLARDIFQNTKKLLQHLTVIMRRIGTANTDLPPEKPVIRISPSHIYAQAVHINMELQILREALAGDVQPSKSGAR